MPPSPSLENDGPVRVSIASNGRQIADTIRVHAVEVRRGIGSIASALIEIADGDMPTGGWDVADGGMFAPGVQISIKAGYGAEEAMIFEGIVIKIGARVDSANASRLLVHCQDKAVTMTIGRRNANHVDKTDSDIMAELCSAHGLSADIEATSVQYRELVQYHCSDWDFLTARAKINGLMVITDAGTVRAKAPATSGSAELIVTWGIDLFEFDADIDARSQIASVTAVAWDPKNQDIAIASEGPIKLNAQGNLSSGALAAALGNQPFVLQSPTMLGNAALEAWAKAEQTRAGLARIRGRMRFQGSAKAVPGALLELAGVGDRFSGTVFTSSILHEIRDGDWHTTAEFGLPSLAEQPGDAPPASGWLPGAAGLQIGIVMKLDADPAGERRIQVKIPVLRAKTEGVWARLLQPHASGDFGAFCVPEIGDEVVIGYFNDDPSSPVVLGSLYSSNRAPPYEIAAENNIKALVTRSKARIEIDDKDVTITIKTPADNRIIIDDRNKSILLSDQHGNRIQMNADGITIDSSKDIVMTAKGNISGDDKMKIALSAASDLSAKGLNATVEAQASLTCKGTASAELSASGTTTVRGAMVMIN